MANDDRILLNLVLNEATVSAVESRVRNLVNRLNNQNVSLNINGRNLDNIVNRLNDIQQRMQTINTTPVNINANLTSAQQQYRLETERMRVSQQLELSRQRTLRTENQAISALAQQNRTLTINNNTTHQIEQEAQNIGNNMNVAGGHARDFVDYLSDGVRYLVTYRSLYAIMNQIGEAFSEIKSVDSAAIQVRKTTGMSKDEIEAIKKASYGVATEYGRSASEYLESVSEFARAGYKHHSTELGKISLLAQNVGDISAETSNKMLLSIDAAYELKGEINELTDVVNALNNIANKNPTSMEKMAEGLQVSASMAKTTGLEISELTALIGTGTAVTQREGSEVGRGIRTVLMNIAQQKGELEDGTIIDSDSIAKAEKALKGVNIQTKHLVSGVEELRNPFHVLKDLSGKWGSLNSVAKNVLLDGIANKRQANILASILDNWSMVEKMQGEYFNSANSAIEENILYLEGWEAKSKVVSAKWTEYISNLADTKTIVGTLDALYTLLNVLDTPIGRIATQIVLVNTALAVTGRLWRAIQARSIVADILSLGAAERNLGEAIQLVSGHLGEQVARWATSPFGTATIAVAGASVLISGIKAYNEKLEETRQEMISLGKETADTNKQVSDLVQQYRKLGEDGQIDTSDQETAKGIQEQIVELVGDQAKNIDLVNGKYDEEIAKLEKIKTLQATKSEADLFDAKNAAEISLVKNATDMFGSWSKGVNVGVGGVFDGKSESEFVAQLLQDTGMSRYTYQTNRLGEKSKGSDSEFYIDVTSYESIIQSYEDMVKLKEIMVAQYKDEVKEGGILYDFYNNLTERIGELSDAVDKYQQATENYDMNQAVMIFNNAIDAAGNKTAESLGLTTGALVKTQEEMQNWISQMLNTQEITDGQKANLIGLAKTHFPNYTTAIDETTDAYFRNELAMITAQNVSDGYIGKLRALGIQCGYTQYDFEQLVLDIGIFNNTALSVADKVAALQELGYYANWAKNEIKAIASVKKVTAYGKDYITAYDENGKLLDIEAVSVPEIPETPPVTIPSYSGGGGSSGGGGGGSSDKNEALDNYLEYAEDLYKVHQDELKYINDIEWAYHNLAKTMEEQAEIAEKIEEARRDYADNRIKDLEHENELLEQVGGTEEQRIANLQEMQRIREEEANRYREWMREQLLGMGYTDEDEISRLIENSDFIQEQQSGWWDAENKKLDLYEQRREDAINDIIEPYDRAISLLESRSQQLDSQLQLAEAKGLMASTRYYEKMQDVEKRKLEHLQSQRDDLTKLFNEQVANGDIEVGSKVWYELQNQIDDITQSIDEATIAVADFDNQMRQVLWDRFDYLVESFSNLTSESDFLVDLLGEDLHDDNGRFNDNGMAVTGLHGANYNVYMEKALSYANELAKIEEEIAKNPYDTNLIARRQELLELQRESILSAESEKQAIVDLVEEGINLELNALTEIIDKYISAIEQSKSLYDYQQKVARQTKNIADIEKQLAAYEGDTSEETKAKIQQLKVDLENAENDLQNTTYDKYLEDTQDLLDDLFEQYSDTLNTRLEDTDALIENMIDAVNDNASSIADTLKSETEKVGTELSSNMESIWQKEDQALRTYLDEDTLIGGFKLEANGYFDQMLNAETGITTALGAIAGDINSIMEYASAIAKAEEDADFTKNQMIQNSKDWWGADDNTKEQLEKENDIYGESLGYTKGEDGSWYDNDGDKVYEVSVSDKVTGLVSQMKKNSSKWSESNTAKENQDLNDANAELAKQIEALTGKKVKYDDASGKWYIGNEELYKKYASGGLADYTGLAWVDGTPSKPELVLSPKDTENFIALKDYLAIAAEKGLYTNPVIPNFEAPLIRLPEIKPINKKGDVNISLNIAIDHVEDYNDFVNQLRKDRQFEKMVQSMSVDLLAGKSSLAKNKYKW